MVTDRRITFVVPAYNAAATLDRCLHSIAGQTYKNIEAIVVDDGSSDGTPRIVRRFRDNDSSFKLITQPNRGVSAARNAALEAASGAIVAFVDADDYLMADAASCFARSFDSDTDLVVGGYNTFRDFLGHSAFEKTIPYEPRRYPSGGGRIDLREFDACLNTPWAKAYSLSLIRKHHLTFENVPLGEDHRFNLRYAALCQGDVKVIQDIVYAYRMGGFASAVRFYENIDELYLGLWGAYREALTSESRLAAPPDFINEVGKSLMDGCVLHYAIRGDRSSRESLGVRAVERFLSNGVEAGDVIDASSYCQSLIAAHRTDILLKRLVRNVRLACGSTRKEFHGR